MKMKAWTRLLFGATALTGVAIAAPALAADLDQTVAFNIAPGSLDEALIAYSQQADLQVISASNAVRGKRTAGVEGATTPREALAMLLQDSGLSFVATSPSTVTVTQGEQVGGGNRADGTVDALIVTAQKREENIQDVPIAISAFSQKDLEEQKIEGGFDLLKAVPNVTFSKNNFTSYNFSIRGIGTKAVSVTTDPGVAVSFNNVALLQNRLFEQEYYDIERVEVLRGPQGTLYGRNATAGVINLISAKPNLGEFSGWVKGEVGNYHSKRISAMINLPLAEDKLAIRVAGALTDRQGYDFNTLTDQPVNGRELWSTRTTVSFEPNDRFRAELLWERFEEDDNRSRTGKQLCHRDDGPTEIDGQEIVGSSELLTLLQRAAFTPGCKPGSLYDDAAFGTPNGLALPFIYTLLQYTYGFTPIGYETLAIIDGQFDFNAKPVTIIDVADPYGGMTQSRDLREIASFRDPIYRAKADVLQLNLTYDVTDNLTAFSQTVYNKDSTYSFQDFNRFNTLPIFNDTSAFYSASFGDYTPENPLPKSRYAALAPGGYFCDPQLGCSNRMAGFDIAQAEATQFTQELRLQSDFEGQINFSVGANFTKFDVDADYYVFNNLITATSLALFLFNTQPDYTKCGLSGGFDFTTTYGTFIFPIAVEPPISMEDPNIACPYIDPNPVENIAGDGHNYYRSKNPYHLKSAAAFGEVYWQVRDDLKVTAGLRYTEDNKRFTPYPTQVLMTPSIFVFGTTFRGLQAEPDVNQNWGEWTGRLGFDWKPEMPFTDETMLYGFYSHGYKGGGANPPRVSFAPLLVQYLPKDYPDVFEPEFVDAFEVGAKNTLLDGALRLNTGAFFYDYKGYQVSKVVDRSIANENFDATIWGLELEAVFAPSRNLSFIGNIGYLDTKIADGERSIDVTNRTQGDPDYIVVKPFVTFPSNCIAPVEVVKGIAGDIGYVTSVCQMVVPDFNGIPDPTLGGIYNPYNYPEINGGAGIYDELGGNELPNSPHFTANIGGQYVFDLFDGWHATIRGDTYWQSQSWARVYNAVNDKLHGWYNANLSLWIENDEGLKIELYAKNILDKTPITDAFINSDDSALTTNVFVLDPRLIGLSIRKEF
jgi:iron complex outermembrane receptor protein